MISVIYQMPLVLGPCEIEVLEGNYSGAHYHRWSLINGHQEKEQLLSIM
jgi:hypothetical protein